MCKGDKSYCLAHLAGEEEARQGSQRGKKKRERGQSLIQLLNANTKGTSVFQVPLKPTMSSAQVVVVDLKTLSLPIVYFKPTGSTTNRLSLLTPFDRKIQGPGYLRAPESLSEPRNIPQVT